MRAAVSTSRAEDEDDVDVEGRKIEGVTDPVLVDVDAVVAVFADDDNAVSVVLAWRGRAEFASVSSMTD